MDNKEKYNLIDSIYEEHSYEIINEIEFECRNRYETLRSDLIYDRFLKVVSTPALTILTGLLASLYLYYRRFKKRGADWHFLDYLLVMLSLIFYQYSKYIILFIKDYLTNGFTDIYDMPETILAFFYMGINPFIFLLALGAFGGIILFINFCLLVPLRQRLQFAFICLVSWIFADFLWTDIVFKQLNSFLNI